MAIDIISVYAVGEFVAWARLPLGTDSLVVALLQPTGLPTDAQFEVCQSFADVFTAGATEANFTNYARKPVTGSGIHISVDTSTKIKTLDVDDQTWSAAGGASNNNLSALIVGYRPTSSATNAQISLITKHVYTGSTTGLDLFAVIPSIATAKRG